eukprot:CAMPEP_0118692078 /NCGR_PEP_ID=MMETSP0800-20121206/11057_1 /TAXON_ID=210618 ORGANISM="Striatella unipunctata, Strain CCMP2910" /NCGR_SAMPLE_ID=MMETSP0800 /ASSEMBLY_ACC=CAM_ASM_000638 /LENGTH=42 /DNA_ID= /DNA_START= /DNA_END= /DNA_ORIENTATION=
MGFFGDAAEAVVEAKIKAEGGYPALIKYRVYRLYRNVCGCCA